MYQGGDNYFNHAQYREGWSYRGQALGTPFIAPMTEFQSAIGRAGFFPDNRVELYYLAAEGTVMNKIHWTTRLAYSRHLGTYVQPFETALSQFSALLLARMPLSGKTQLQTTVAVDRGAVYPETIGASVSLVRTLN